MSSANSAIVASSSSRSPSSALQQPAAARRPRKLRDASKAAGCAALCRTRDEQRPDPPLVITPGTLVTPAQCRIHGPRDVRLGLLPGTEGTGGGPYIRRGGPFMTYKR